MFQSSMVQDFKVLIVIGLRQNWKHLFNVSKKLKSFYILKYAIGINKIFRLASFETIET